MVGRVAAAVGVLGLVTAGGVLVGAPAFAGPNCPAGYHCVMRDSISDNHRHAYFNSDNNFTDDAFTNGGGVVNDNVSAASNSSTGGFESWYYYDAGYVRFAFCVNPGSSVASLPDDGHKGNGIGLNDEVSSLKLHPSSTTSCY
jgi:hypothetical protein